MLPDAATGFRREAVSPKVGFAAYFCRVVIHGWEVGLFEIRMFIVNLVFSHSSAEPPEHVPYSNAKSADARLSASFSRLDRDSGANG